MYIKSKQNVYKETTTNKKYYGYGEFIYPGRTSCYDSYDDGYDNFDSFDDFDLNAWGKGACLHTYRTERRSGGQRYGGGVYSTKHVRLAEGKQSHNHNLNKYDLKKSWKKTKCNASVDVLLS